MTAEAELRDAVEAWIADDPDAGDRAELQALLGRAYAGRDAAAAQAGRDAAGDSAARAFEELRDRFAGRLEFGTAGLRGVIAAGPNRMNRAVVRAATAAVTGWLLGSRGAGDALSVVVGCDARHRSAEFADETARVLAGAGVAVHMLPQPGPTPLLAFAVRHLAASAGVMITASHNPAADNGYKLYLSDGAQVIPPADAEIEARMASAGPLSQIPVAEAGSPLITWHGDEIARAYLDRVVPAAAGPRADWPKLNVVYTPLHGVAGDLMLRAIAQAGFAAPHVVTAQARPDPDFPTVAFPNPEEPGALDLALADALRLGADLVLASDPDGDRLAVATRRPGHGLAGWVVLTGDQVGALIGASLLERTAGDGVPGARFVFGYEEALGYAVGDVVRDKDGIGAALAMLALAAGAKTAGRSVLDRYDALETAHGVHLTSQVTLRTADQAQVMRRLRADPPAEFAGQPVTALTDLARGGDNGLPAADVLIFRLPGARVVLRPSGTEPKIKCYIEIVEPLRGRSLPAARGLAAERLAPLRHALETVLVNA